LSQKHELVIAKRFYKDLRQIDAHDQQRILEALRQIRAEPYKGRKVIVAKTGQYRWRVGPYRRRYDIEGDQIQVLRVRHRREAY
jgi:mRNA-degrading endonuclease RelE of RelBE toxin-antitoxin system